MSKNSRQNYKTGGRSSIARCLPTVPKLFVSKMDPEFRDLLLTLDFENSETKTPNERVKTMTDEVLDKSVEDQKSKHKPVYTIRATCRLL